VPVMPAAAPLPSARPASATGEPVSEHSDRVAAVAPSAPNAAEQQRIVTIRVCTAGEARWSGTQLMAALELHGLAFGRYQVFHRKHADGRSLFCVASLIEPGIFDIAQMAEQEFRGVTLFAVLPGPIQPLETMDELLGTAHGLAEELSGMVQDGRGMPLSPQRAAALREDIARFQASLPRN
jgi:cell division protein ZipA